MDIIDVMLARAMTPQGQTDIYVNKANQAAAQAAKAQQDAAAAIATVTAAANDIAETKDSADALLAEAQETLATAQEAQINTLNTEDVDEEIAKLDVSVNLMEGQAANTYQVITTYPDNTLNTENATKMYKATGANEDGTMTQKAITDALSTKVESTTLNNYATIVYVDNAIANLPSGGGSGGGNANTDVNSDDNGHLVVVDENGNLTASEITEPSVIDALITAGAYTIKGSIGLDIDYSNRTFTRVQDAANLSMGSDFDTYRMYGGRVRCNVSDDGTINAFYGQNGYTEDGSNGQVMVYQPKFYYKRIIRSFDNLSRGKAVRHEALLLAPTAINGFKLAPIFNEDLEYVLLPAFDGSIDENKLASIAGARPVNNITIAEAENYAVARGNGWHIMNMAAESANQMLEMVEFGTMNGQAAIEQGITYIPSNAGNNTCYFITGSTSALGNGTGHATSTQVDIGGNISNSTVDTMRAISYRGMENPWGNFWSMIGGINVIGNSTQDGGVPYICTDFNYTPTVAGNNYEDIGFNIPSRYGWVNAMGYGNSNYDWVYLPAECSTNANSLLPVGDGMWTVPNLNGSMIVATGGSMGYKEECGPFYYAIDRNLSTSARYNYGAKLMYIPTKNNIYLANISKWNAYMGG